MKDYFCEHCFEDKNIKKYIKDNGEIKKEKFDCNFCSFETEVDKWEIDDCIDEYYRPWLSKCFDDEGKYRLESWEAFREHTKHKARYFEHKDNKLSVIRTLKDFEPFFEKMTTLNNELIYRVRPIYKDEDKEDIRKNRGNALGKAPTNIVKNNRFSPVGISYGYFAFDEKTALIESRVNINDEVGIAEFKLDKSLQLIDFRDEKLAKSLNPFPKGFDINMYCNAFFLNAFIKDISKPISDEDSLLEYVPTQIMAEYIWSIGYDGFIFDSSQKKGGENIVIFGDNPTYRKHKIVRIKNVQYDLEELIV